MNYYESNFLKSNLVCYFTDRGYIIPSIFSAVSCSDALSVSGIQIKIFAIGLKKEEIKIYNDALFDKNIIIEGVEPVWRGLYDEKKFRECHISEAALGRLFLHEFIGSEVKNILYIDGDTIINRDINSIFGIICDQNSVFMAADYITFCYDSPGLLGRDARRYFVEISHRPGDIYFNSGVMLGGRSAWVDVSRRAFEYFRDNVEKCHHIDQTAINVACRDIIRPISIKWNVQTYFRLLNILKEHSYISHFNGDVKPWTESRWPNRKFSALYSEMIAMINDRLKVEVMKHPRDNNCQSARNMLKVLSYKTLKVIEFNKIYSRIYEYEKDIKYP